MLGINFSGHKILVLNEESFETAVNVCSKNHNYVVNICISNASDLERWFTKVVHNLNRYAQEYGAKEFVTSADNSYATLEFYNNSWIEIGYSSSLLFKSYQYNDLICDNRILQRDNLICRLERRYKPYMRRKSNRSWECVSIDCKQNIIKDWTNKVDTSKLDEFLNSFKITQIDISRGTDT